MRRAVLAATLLVAVTPATVLAHASLIAADPGPGTVVPAPPERVTVRFSEPVSAAGEGLTVVSPSGRRADRGRVRSLGQILTIEAAAAEPGTYLVRWSVIAQDTHPARGSFTFSVGHPSPRPAEEDLRGDVAGVAAGGLLLEAVSRWLHLLGLAFSFGVLAFGGPPGRLVYMGLALLLAAEPTAIAAQTLAIGLPPQAVLASSFGRVLGLRLGGALLLWAGLGAGPPGRWLRAGLLTLGAALALVDGAAAHRLAGPPAAAAFSLTALHEGAMTLSLGGLAAAMARRPSAHSYVPWAAAAFGAAALSGAVLAFAHLRAPSDLFQSQYGGVLALKIVAVGVAALAAFLSQRRLQLLALAGVLGIAGLLLSLPPPR